MFKDILTDVTCVLLFHQDLLAEISTVKEDTTGLLKDGKYYISEARDLLDRLMENILVNVIYFFR